METPKFSIAVIGATNGLGTQNPFFSDRLSINSNFFQFPEESPLIGADDDTFLMYCKSQLKISARNSFLKQKIERPVFKIDETPRPSHFSPEKINERTIKQLDSKRKKRFFQEEFLSERFDETHKPEESSCLSWFIIRNNGIKSIIPDFELKECKLIFNEILTKNIKSHEANFGMCRLYAYEGRYGLAMIYIKDALQISPNDKLYNLWYAMLNMKTIFELDNISQKSLPSGSRMWCCGSRSAGQFSVVFPQLIEKLTIFQGEIDVLWCLMTLSLKNCLEIGREIENPRFYAAKIKEIDNYYGYVAWSDILFSEEGQEAKGRDTLRECIMQYPNRPEAYIKLWQYYYYNVKDFEQSEDIACEAFIRVCGSDDSEYFALLCINYAKSCFKMRKINYALKILQQKYIENPEFPIFLYHIGRLSTKSEDLALNGLAIGTLEECLRQCDKCWHGPIYYWLAKAYLNSKQHVEAYGAMKQSYKYLENSDQRKSHDLKSAMKSLKEGVSALKEVEEILKSESFLKNIDKCKRLCNKIKGLNKLSGEVLQAKILWSEGRKEEAIRELESSAYMASTRIMPYFELLRCLELSEDYLSMRTYGKEMVLKSMNSQLPCTTWVKANIIFAKILVKNNELDRALRVLKALAKIFPITRYAEIPFTLKLQESSTYQDLDEANNLPRNSLGVYSFSSSRNSYASISAPAYSQSYKDQVKKNTFRRNQELLTLLIGEDAPHPEETLESNPDLYENDELDVTGFKKFQNLSIEFEFNNEDLQHQEIMKPMHSDNELCTEFAVSSDPIFLYKIGKIAAMHGINLMDGLYAIEDYLSLLKFEKSIAMKERAAVKALLLKFIILCQLNNIDTAAAVAAEIDPIISQVGWAKKYELFKDFKARHNI
ncbi:unnamed protein product [Blepharisma stoltei]|uniref:Uncharacterized protein n=1 Tax=Blepharisma stoltei TaxID=1481888 RepID=A0AAU9K7H6_9CILI|nr:unnamed protein product [Blepharisma stoltei]